MVELSNKIAAMITFEELEEIIDIIKNLHGYDVSGYTRSSLKRRVTRIMELNKLDLVELKSKLINQPGFSTYLLQEITVNVTEMFRDPEFYKALKNDVFPYLATYPHIKLWSAGCSTGEEVYSLAILLKEAGLYQRSFIYGTDINTKVLEKAKRGIYSLAKVKDYSENFIKTDPKSSLSEYYTAMYNAATINNSLKKNVLFSQHSLVSDRVFNEFQLITCRNVLIYFDTNLQEKVLDLFYNSLCHLGFLCLGSKESLINYKNAAKFKVVNKKHNIYQKIG
ncbi:protein-glutamate O-methyltransferase CheR [Sphingobacterium sp. ML3W]|jgi:Methylase of chemotaxis methyl-accepting proteins|uniref:CheR family methyltransferase n=2 Tax=Sphingobacterium sp. ML3W TaxID=1538644 RepID=UPI00249BB09F|nr:protein-glutamate O-methyltransferase CheR [Sphingobacterium sp. ML3W]WFA77611.1 protein-glutamate O-methyltransferase CheR [Sphingobacterium sp. ML3W]